MSSTSDTFAGVDPHRAAILAELGAADVLDGHIDEHTGRVVIPEPELILGGTVTAVSIDTQLIPLVEMCMRHICRTADEQRALLQACRLIDRTGVGGPAASWERDAAETFAQVWCRHCGHCSHVGTSSCEECGSNLDAITVAPPATACQEDPAC